MSTKPFAIVKVPIPGLMFTVIPVPELSVMDQASRTISLPPPRTVLGFELNVLICGAGQPATVMVIVCSTLQEPLELTAVSRYVVVVLGVTVRLPLVLTGFPLSSTWAAFDVDH